MSPYVLYVGYSTFHTAPSWTLHRAVPRALRMMPRGRSTLPYLSKCLPTAVDMLREHNDLNCCSCHCCDFLFLLNWNHPNSCIDLHREHHDGHCCSCHCCDFQFLLNCIPLNWNHIIHFYRNIARYTSLSILWNISSVGRTQRPAYHFWVS